MLVFQGLSGKDPHSLGLPAPWTILEAPVVHTTKNCLTLLPCGHTTPREPHDLSHQGLRPPSPRRHAKPCGNVGAAGCLRRYATGGGMPKSLYQLSGYKLVPLGLPVHWREFLSGSPPLGSATNTLFQVVNNSGAQCRADFRRVGSVISLNEISNRPYCWHSPPDACCARRATPRCPPVDAGAAVVLRPFPSRSQRREQPRQVALLLSCTPRRVRTSTSLSGAACHSKIDEPQ